MTPNVVARRGDLLARATVVDHGGDTGRAAVVATAEEGVWVTVTYAPLDGGALFTRRHLIHDMLCVRNDVPTATVEAVLAVAR